MILFDYFSDGLKPLWCFVMSKSALGWRVCPEYLSSKSATCLRFSINRIDCSTYYNLFLAVYYINDVYCTHIIYIHDTYMNINDIFLYAVCCVPFFSHFYVKKAYLLLTLPMFRISAGSFHPRFSDLAVTAGTVGTRRFRARPRWNRRDFSWILRMCGWLTPETNRDTGIHRWCYIIFTCLYIEIYISWNILIWYMLICHYWGPTKKPLAGFPALAVSFRNYYVYLEKMAWMFLCSKRWCRINRLGESCGHRRMR